MDNKFYIAKMLDMQEYIPVALFLVIALFIAIVMVLIPKFIAPFVANKAKIQSYECGFGQKGMKEDCFNVRFYLVAMLFVIFDLEIIFLFPWAVALRQIGMFGFFSMMVFLGILTVGFLYELKTGALEWD